MLVYVPKCRSTKQCKNGRQHTEPDAQQNKLLLIFRGKLHLRIDNMSPELFERCSIRLGHADAQFIRIMQLCGACRHDCQRLTVRQSVRADNLSRKRFAVQCAASLRRLCAASPQNAENAAAFAQMTRPCSVMP